MSPHHEHLGVAIITVLSFSEMPIIFIPLALSANRAMIVIALCYLKCLSATPATNVNHCWLLCLCCHVFPFVVLSCISNHTLLAGKCKHLFLGVSRLEMKINDDKVLHFWRNRQALAEGFQVSGVVLQIINTTIRCPIIIKD